eukprot:g11478.t1
MDAFNPARTPGYDQFGRCCWYNKAAGRVHRLSQPPVYAPHRCQVQQAPLMMPGHAAGGSEVCAEQPTAAKGSYYNPLAADMAAWGILIQPPRSDSTRTLRLGETGWRRMAWNNHPRAPLEPKKMPKKQATSRPIQERYQRPKQATEPLKSRPLSQAGVVMDTFGDMGHQDDARPLGRFYNPLASLAKGAVWEKVGDVAPTEHGVENKSDVGLDRDDSFSRMLATCKLEHLLSSPSMRPTTPPSEEDGAENHKSGHGLERDDSFSRMLAASKLQNPVSDSSIPSAPSLPPPPPPPLLLLPPTTLHTSPGKASDMPTSRTTPPQPERREPTRHGAGLDESSRRPRISGLRVWDGPAPQPLSPALSRRTRGGGGRMSGKYETEGAAFLTISPGVPGNTWEEGDFAPPSSGIGLQHPRSDPRTSSWRQAESSRRAQDFGTGRPSGGPAWQSSVPPLRPPPPITRKRKSPGWSEEHPAAEAGYFTGGRSSPASHENPDWFRGN